MRRTFGADFGIAHHALLPLIPSNLKSAKQTTRPSPPNKLARMQSACIFPPHLSR